MRQVSKPDRVGVVARNSPDFIDTILRITEQGHVAAILRFHDDTERSSLASVNMIVDPERSGGWLERQFTPRRDDAIAQISFTSGTEGAPKAVLLSHRALTDVTDRLQTLMSLDNSVREYIGVPVYHSFGFGRCRSVCAAGGKAYVPASGLQVPELVTMLKAGLINAISAVPSQWRLLLSHKDLLRPYGDRIRWIEIGSQYMSGDEKEQLRLLFQNAKIIQHYGLTEASRATLLEIHKEDREQLESVGRAIGEVEVKTEADGRICVRGPLLASGMLVGGREVSITDAEGWFKTNDLGYFRDNYLHFLGRADDVINCGGIKLYPETLERRMHQMLGTDQGFAITKTVDQIRGDGILVLREEAAPDPDSLRAAAIAAMKADGVNASSAVRIRDVRTISKTDTGKVRRQSTAAVEDREQGKCTGKDSKSTLRDLIRHSLGVNSVADEDTFSKLGGDSLAYVHVSLILDQLLGHTPPHWEHLTIKELEALIGPFDTVGLALSFDTASHLRPKAPPLPRGDTNGNPTGLSFWALVREDFATHDRDLFSQGFVALFVNRFGNWRMSVRPKLIRAPLTLIYRMLAKLCQVFCGIKLDYTVSVGRRVKLEHFGGMILGARRIGDGVIVRQNTTIGIRHISDLNAKPIIEDNVDIGAGAVIIGNITVGRGSVIGANCVVTVDIPAHSLVDGNPARIRKIGLLQSELGANSDAMHND